MMSMWTNFLSNRIWSSVFQKINSVNADCLVETCCRSLSSEISHAKVKHRGIDILRDSRINKGMAFSLKERQVLGIHGLLPPAFMKQSQQAYRVMENVRRENDNLSRYTLLSSLQDRNEKLFYKVLCDNVEALLPVVYTPTVGLACQKFGVIYRKPKGLYITIHDNSIEHIYQILSNWPEHDVKAIVMTDGERILGLGDLGAYGMGIPVGKLSLYVALGGIRPEWCLPILLDVGTDSPSLLEDPLYTGLKHKRIRDQRYDTLIDNVMAAVVKKYGQDTLIQFEDFANRNAFRLLQKYRGRYCTFNDDIQGTASVALAGLHVANRLCKKEKLSESKILFYGAGSAAVGIAQLICMAMEREGSSTKEAKEQIWMIDKFGLLVTSRNDLGENEKYFAKDYKEMTSLEEIVNEVRPSAIIGASGAGGAFTEKVIRAMAAINKRPLIYALSNPTAQSECTAEQAYTFSEGRAIYASGSPFEPFELNGKMYYPSQANNAYIFPGVALGAVICRLHQIPDEIFLIASQTLADQITSKHLDEGRLFPPLPDVRNISIKIAAAVAEFGYKNRIASHHPEPEDKELFVRQHMYSNEYDNFLPDEYDWPEQVMKSSFPE